MLISKNKLGSVRDNGGLVLFLKRYVGRGRNSDIATLQANADRPCTVEKERHRDAQGRHAE
jgi:hypothetical protein